MLIYILYIFIAFIVLAILSVLMTPVIDSAMRFSKFISIDFETLKKNIPNIVEKEPELFPYKLDLSKKIYYTEKKLYIGGESHIYFEIDDNKVSSILILSKFNGDRYFNKGIKYYIESRKEEYKKDSDNHHGQVYNIFPKNYRSSWLRSKFFIKNFDFGLNHNNKFFIFIKNNQ